MPPVPAKVVFFDLGDTLGIPRFDAVSGALSGFDCFPFVPEALTKMQSPNTRLGVISNTPAGVTQAQMSSILAAAGILPRFDPSLLLFSSVEGLDKTKPAFFTLAATRAGQPPDRCVFVGESAAEREVAKSVGMRPSFHILHAFHVLSQF